VASPVVYAWSERDSAVPASIVWYSFAKTVSFWIVPSRTAGLTEWSVPRIIWSSSYRIPAGIRLPGRTPEGMGTRRSLAPGQPAAGYTTGRDVIGRTMYVPQYSEPAAGLLNHTVRDDEISGSYSDDMVSGMLDLFHRTTPAAAAAIYASGRMLSKENTGEAFFSTSSGDGQADGYGTAVVHIRVPEELAELDDEFPDGEQHYRVAVTALKAEHFVR
jgi:hypothetical protein